MLNSKEIVASSESTMNIEESKETINQETEELENHGGSNLSDGLKIEGQYEAQIKNLDTGKTKDDEIEKKIREGIKDHIFNEIEPSNLNQLEVKMIDSLQKGKKENDENPKQEDKLEPLIEEVSSAEKDIPVQVKEDIKESSIASSPNSVERVKNDNQDSKEDKVKSPVDQKVKNKKNNQEKEKPEKHNKEEKKEKKSSAEKKPTKDGSKGKRKKIEETTK